MGNSAAAKVLLVLWLLALTGSSVALWLMPSPSLRPIVEKTAPPIPSPTPLPPPTPTLADWNAAIATLAAQLNKPTPRPTSPTTNPSAPAPTAQNPVREVILPLGGGNSTSLEWTPLYTAEFQLDPSKYGQIVSARWEAAGSIVSGETTARLIDITHSRTYYDAVLLFNSSTATWKRSGTLPLSSQTAVYRVEVRSSNGERANLHEARLILEVR